MNSSAEKTLRKHLRRVFALLPVILCFFLCSCSTTTWQYLGCEEFTWSPDKMQITKTPDQKHVVLVKNGTLRKYFIPYDFSRRYPTSIETISRTVKFSVPEKQPFFAVKVDPSAKSLAEKYYISKQTGFCYENIKINPAESISQIQPVQIAPEDFKKLQNPFWYQDEECYWNICVPEKAMKYSDYFIIPVTYTYRVRDWHKPYMDQTETLRYKDPLTVSYRVVCFIPAFVFDVVTFPIQIVLLVNSH